MTYAPAVHPNSDPLPPPPAPTAVPLPPAAFLSMDSAMHTLPPLNIPTQPPIYTIPPPTIPLVTIARAPIPTTDHFPFQTPQPKISFSYPAPPSLNIPPTEPGTPTQAAPPPLPTNIPPKVENEQERRIRRMEETIGALQASSSRFDYGDSNSNLFPGMWLPPKIKIPNFKRYDGTSDSRHHLCHYQSKMMSYKDYEKFVVQTFQDSLAGSALDWFMTLKADDIPTWTDLSQKFLDQYRFCAESPYTPRSQHNGDEGKSGFRSLCEYAHPMHYTQAYPSAPPIVIHPPPTQQYVPAQAQQNRAPASRSPQPAQHAPALRAQQGSAAQPRPRKQYTILLTLTSHIFRQLLIGNKIKTKVPGPNFDPTVQNQNLHCEFHQGAPGHTLDTCWRLRDRIQEMIDARQISFNEVKPPNVANPLPDH
ncbi:hypothetical protein CRG98_011364 [Punica granatum]|uniref:Retrotransposon gag domain-containing protein n=1 Tax=Punica granatum TaxID=22663 RepID=A0A2I0KIB0_PUNGR|nr:hypothetical protein CRG98_011364 [Punica granatum]